MKRILYLTILALTLSLFLLTQSLANPAISVQAKKPPAASKTPGAKATQKAEDRAEKTPGAKATEKADQHATRQAGKSHGKHQNFKGAIRSVDASSITLELKDGASVTISLNEETSIKMPGQKEASLDSLQVGVTCMVQAIGDSDEALTARTVMVIPSKPSHAHHVGWVMAYTPGASITIQAHDGASYTFALAAEVKILPAERAGELAIGSRVTVIAPRNLSGSVLTAAGIVVHPAGSGEGSAPTLEAP